MNAVVPCLVLALAATAATAADDTSSQYEEHVFAGRGEGKLPYRLLPPEKVEAGKKYPLVLVLHGWGERGTDNQKQLKDFGAVFAKPATRKRFPCFVLVPQAHGSWVRNTDFAKPLPLGKTPTDSLALTNELVQSLLKTRPVDADRLYLTGYSNGACGVWELLERAPRVWAAAAPMAGAADPARVGVAKGVPIWAFHGAKDPTIPPARMNELIDALRAAHGHPLFTVYPNGVHYDAKKGLHDPTLLPWLFAQRRGAPEVPFDKVAGPKAKPPTSLEKKK